MLMPIPPDQPRIVCPACGADMLVPLQARMRAAESGTAVNCAKCGGVWLLQLKPDPVFSSLSTPKRKRGPKRYHPPENESGQ